MMQYTTRTKMALPALVLLLAGGCASLRPHEVLPPDVTPQRIARKTDAVNDFEDRRNQAQYLAAVSRWEQGVKQECEVLLLKLLSHNEGHRQARLLLADVYLDTDNLPAAQRQLKWLLERYPDDAQVHHTSAMLMEFLDRPEEALTHFQRAAELEPDNELYAQGYRIARGQEIKQISYISDQAADDLPELLSAGGEEIPGTDDSPAKTLGDHPDKEDHPAKAQSSNRPSEVRQVRPDGLNGIAHKPAQERLDAAVAASEEDRWAEAVEIFIQAMDAEPENPQIPTNAALYLLRHDKSDEAVELVGRALKTHPKSANLLRILGAAHYQKRQFKKSQVALQQALSLDNSCPLAYFLLGCSLAELGQDEEAARFYQKAHRLDARYPARR